MKLKEQLIEMGLTDELAQKVIDDVIDGNYIPKTRFNEINEENKTLKKSISEYDEQLESLKKSSGDNEALTKQISDLQTANAEQQKAHEKELKQLRLDNAIEIELSSAKAKNTKAVRAMLDMTKVTIGDDGNLAGLKEQLDALQQSDAYMFDAQPATQQFTGFQPGVSSTVPNSVQAGYEAQLANARKNNNNLEVIQIKQNAAKDGIILM